jgi:hypothetical protein
MQINHTTKLTLILLLINTSTSRADQLIYIDKENGSKIEILIKNNIKEIRGIVKNNYEERWWAPSKKNIIKKIDNFLDDNKKLSSVSKEKLIGFPEKMSLLKDLLSERCHKQYDVLKVKVQANIKKYVAYLSERGS